ncbi:MAG: prolipoprotein diacylglyceryl transferase [Frankiaceae bacterium]
MTLASIPSPDRNTIPIGGFELLHMYAVMIIIGIVVAVVICERRFVARGFPKGTALDLVVWAVPFGIVGARLYHVITDWQTYFGAVRTRQPVEALYVWQGGLGIWGGIAGGALGVYIAARRKHLSFADLADAGAPALPVAQAIGRWGNWWNQELFGGPTSLPWGLEIDPAHRPPDDIASATYQPTFLYESVWDVSVALICIWADRRFRLDRGRVFALYVALYCAGRAVTEALRSDHASMLGGLRVNEWVSIALFLFAVGYIVVVSRRPRRRPEHADAGQVSATPRA